MKTRPFPALLIAALCLTAVPLLAGEDEPRPTPPLHFAIRLGVEDVVVIHGWLEDSGDGYDKAHLDRDGDGRADETIEFPGQSAPAGALTSRLVRIPLVHENLKWQLYLYGLRFPQCLETHGEETHVRLTWDVTKGEATCTMGGGVARLYPTAEAAKEGKAIRVGPPFRFDVRAASRGYDAVIRVKLYDENEGYLSSMRSGIMNRSIRVKLAQDDQEKLDAPIEYG